MEHAPDPGEGTSPIEAAAGSTHYTNLELRSVRWGLWNVRGFVQKDHCRLRECVVQAMNLDIICLCETFLRNNDSINIEGYRWFGNNRKTISRRAIRGSGGVGILVKESLFDSFSIDVVDKKYEDILWIACTQIGNPENTLYVCVCYLPPVGSSRGDKLQEVFDILRSQILHFQDKGEIMICGDFNARIGHLNEYLDRKTEVLPQREVLDNKINTHGRQLVDFLRDNNMIVLNGRGSKEKDDFTLLSTTGKSVVDYVIIQAEYFTKYNLFEVTPVIDILERFNILPDSSMPDHSLICWQCKLPQHKLTNTTSTMIPKRKITYRRQMDKPVFKSERAVQSLEDLISDLDTIRSVNDTKIKENKLINNYNSFYSLIEKEYCRPVSHHCGSSKPWWNQELTAHRKQLRRAHKAWRTETNKEIRTKLWNDFKKEQKILTIIHAK